MPVETAPFCGASIVERIPTARPPASLRVGPMDISLNGHEARALGVLIEKAFTTPDQYPLSLNATTNGCNQKSNREPVVDFSEAEVRIALQGLRMKGLAGQSVPAGSRVERWRHNAMEALGLGEREAAVLAELLLRGPQTAGELRSRAKRMRDLPDLEALEHALGGLRDRGYAETAEGGRAPRTSQVLCRDVDPDAALNAPTEVPMEGSPAPTEAAHGGGEDPLARRVLELEHQVAELTRSMAQLREELGA